MNQRRISTYAIHEGGVIFKSQIIVIQMALRSEMKRRLHAVHIGYDSLIARTRDTIFWPRMSSEVKQLANVKRGRKLNWCTKLSYTLLNIYYIK